MFQKVCGLYNFSFKLSKMLNVILKKFQVYNDRIFMQVT